MKKLIIFFAFFIALTNANAQITLGLYNGAAEGRGLTIKLSSPANYSGQGESGSFFILRWPTDPNGVAVTPVNFLGQNGFSSTQSDWIMSNSYPFYGTNGGYTYRLVEYNGTFTTPASWNAPNNVNILSFDMTGGSGIAAAVELASDAYTQAMIDTRYGFGMGTYFSDIGLPNPTVVGFSPSSVPFVQLPLKLNGFYSVADNCDAKLTWVTNDEINFNHFEVEQSTDNINFKKLASIPGSGKIAGSTYNFTATQSNGPAYYRLKLVENDNGYEYSNTTVVKTNCSGGKDYFTMYPNPVSAGNNTLNLNFSAGYNGKGQVIVYNNLGQVVLNNTISVIKGNNIVHINIANLTSGTYTVKTVTAGGDAIGPVQKLIKQN